MPCNSDYMEPNSKEKLLRETAELLIFVRKSMGLACSTKLKAAAENQYCKDDYVADLCKTIRQLDSAKLESIVYNGRNPTSRKLADWWEAHQAADEARIQKFDKTSAAHTELTALERKIGRGNLIVSKKFKDLLDEEIKSLEKSLWGTK